MGLLRLMVFGFIGLSIVYLIVAFYSRSVRREKLEKRWAEDHPDGGDAAARETYIETGMQAYNSSIRPKLILLVYIIPAVLVVAIHILTTYY